MIGREFYDRLQNHSRLEWLGSLEGTSERKGVPARSDRAFARNRVTLALWEISVASILSQTWEDLEALLLGQRDAHILTHVARIVGYYSFTRNWNGSKLAELADRHRGDYGVPGETPDLDGALPVGIVEDLAAGGAELACDVGKGRAGE